MSRGQLSLVGAGLALMVLAGLGIGYGGSRWWRAEAPPTTERAPGAQAHASATGVRKHALLVGVTKYDHIPKEHHLFGPANDVKLLRRLLEERYGFQADNIVALTEEEGTPERRPTRANIERAFQQLADQAREDDQVVILLSGHGARQPENDPPDPNFPEPDGIDEIFLPADVRRGEGTPLRVPNAIIDNELGRWLAAITAKKAFVWIIFDCCHSGTMTRGTEVVRELPPNTLIPQEELDKARSRAAGRGQARRLTGTKTAGFLDQAGSDHLVALYACRPHEKTPECRLPAGAKYHGLLTYTLVDILTRSATANTPVSYRELGQRIQVRYAGRPQGSPTPTVEGKGQDRIVLGMKQAVRSRILLLRDREGYKVNAGDLYGLTIGSVLAVYAPEATAREPRLVGHVCVQTVQPFEAAVEPCAYEQMPPVHDLPELSSCQPVFLDYGLRRFKVCIQQPQGQQEVDPKLVKALEALSSPRDGLIEMVTDTGLADWLIRVEGDRLELVEASGNRPPFALPGLDDPGLADGLRRNLGKVFRARNLIALASKFEGERYRGEAAVNVDVEVLQHRGRKARGEVVPRPPEGWVFRPGDLISFRVTNKSPSLALDVTLLIIGTDYEIHAFYPRKDETSKTLQPGETRDTPPPPGEIGSEPPFGPECLVVIAVPAKNPPVDFAAFAQDGLSLARAADRSDSLRSPLGELLQGALYRSRSSGTLSRSVAEQHGMRVLTWRTEAR